VTEERDSERAIRLIRELREARRTIQRVLSYEERGHSVNHYDARCALESLIDAQIDVLWAELGRAYVKENITAKDRLGS
jgi:hypothetical protein